MGTRTDASTTPSIGDDKETGPVAPLVAASRHLLQSNGSILGRHVAQAILPQFPTLLSALPIDSMHPALSCIDGRKPITCAQIREFVLGLGTQLHNHGWGRGNRVAVVLPNGPELALALWGIGAWCCCVPLNANGAAMELESDLVASSCCLVIGVQGSTTRQLANKLNISFGGLTPDRFHAGLFSLSLPDAPHGLQSVCTRAVERDRSAGDPISPVSTIVKQTTVAPVPNAHDDIVLVLFTSGTTGSKKLVPHRLGDLLVSAACIAVSWNLTPADINCNLMPLFHVGGIVRQVFSPILSGGCVICCPSFDPLIFWNLLRSQSFTWYYAAPTMHQLILQTGRAEGFIEGNGSNETTTINPKLRMIANAAGGLLPSLARELQHIFGAAVLPSYGMTECMPISSPPATYQLEKPGTSGVSVGPELAILNLKTLDLLDHGKEGPICVRNEPCFRGYEDTPQEASFLPGGWFNTGDLGYIDEDGFLYITGRSKEVINRGGEIISPLEVEEALNGHVDVAASIAFSTQHSVLQEVVGIVIVPQPGRPRIDLPALHEFLGQGRLAAPKWPQCIVYMDSLPKSNTNKLLRVMLGQRLGLPELNDSMYSIDRTFQAKCPKPGTSVSVAIPCERVALPSDQVQQILREALVTNVNQEIVVVHHPTRMGSLVAYVYQVDRVAVIAAAKERLHAYAVPSHVVQMPSPFQVELDISPPQPSDAVGSILQKASNSGQGPMNPLVLSLQELFQELLDLDCLPAPRTNFFNLGGSSMLASQLASRVRKQHDVPFGGAEVFHHSSCEDIATLIRERQDGEWDICSSVANGDLASVASSLFSRNLDLKSTPFDPNKMNHSSSCCATFLQLMPLFVIYPVWQLSRFYLFFRLLLILLNAVPGGHHLVAFIISVVVFHFLWVLLTPLLFVVIKWTMIGTYRKGRYPLWGEYYLRWWFVDVMRKLIGRGIWGSNAATLNLYYRLLGARIGRYARISLEADIAEFDLINIGEGACIEYSTLRPFGVDNGAMILGPMGVGSFSSVGARSVVAPYTFIPDDTHLGAATSSYEISTLHINQSKQYNRQAFPEPGILAQLFVCRPIVFLVETMSHIPALLILYWMISMPWHDNEAFDTMSHLMEWLCNVRRIPFYIGIHVARALLAPIFQMGAAILVKRYIIGSFKPGPRDTASQWQLCRHQLVSTLFSRQNMQDCTELLGRHYELVSVLYRVLGAKVGNRVFWPGHQPVFSGEFDLLEIGDDVVFGSRATMICTTIDSCEKITLSAGSNVSDNAVVLPGSMLGKNAVLGSNAVCPGDWYLPEASVWFGAIAGEPVMLEKGVEDISHHILSSEVSPDRIQMQGDESTLRPFGKAFYYRQAPYFVLPMSFVILFTVLSKIMISLVHTVPLLGALHATAVYFYGHHDTQAYDSVSVASSQMYIVLLSFFLLTHAGRVAVWIGIELGAKWLFVGRRQPGRYNWDKTPYIQNWELYQIITKVRSSGRTNFMDLLAGTPFLVAFFRGLGCTIGRDCCLYPAGADPFMPEPDLVQMGDRCVIDCASVACHLNTRGNFELVKITLENDVTLRTRSRIQQGVHMENNSMLLEKSLAMTGEEIEANSVWQGAPAVLLFSYDTTTMATGRSTCSSDTTDSILDGGLV